MIKPKTLNHIDQLVGMIKLLKKVVISLAGVITFLTLLLTFKYFEDPIAVIVRSNKTSHVSATKKDIAPSTDEILGVARIFILNHYEWDDPKMNTLLLRHAPYVTRSLKKELERTLKRSKALKGKKLSQYVGNLELKLKDDEIHARFDRILRIDGIPLISPLMLRLKAIRSTRTHANPAGIYIQEVEEYETR